MIPPAGDISVLRQGRYFIQGEVHGCSRLEFMEISDENSSRIRLDR